MSHDTWESVDFYITDQLHDHDPILDAVLAASADAGLPDIHVSATQGKLLNLLARWGNAQRILEIGTLAGYSTIWLARALSENGKLITLESEPLHAEVARANLKRAGVDQRVKVITGAAIDSLNELKSENADPFDLVFLDADKESYPDYLPAIIELSRPGTLVIADNIIRNGDVIDRDSEDSKVQGVQSFNDLLASEPRIDATAIQTVGSKGYDGFVIGVVDEC